jgi:hypothetical protein
VRISFAPAPQFDAAFRSGILEQLAGGIERCVGPFWRCELAEEQGQVFSETSDLRRLSPVALARNPALQEIDKAFLIAVAPAGAGITL